MEELEKKQEWKRLPSESSRCFHAFTIYRDLGPERSLEKVRQEFGKSSAKKSLRLLERWSTDWSWVKRAEAYDEHLEAIKLLATEKERREIGAREAKLGMQLQQLAMAALQHFLDADGHVVPLSVAEIARLVETGVKIERLGRGESTDIFSEVAELSVVEVPVGDSQESEKQSGPCRKK